MNKELKEYLEDRANWVRKKSLEMCVKSGNGHVSTAFSQAELLVALYHGEILQYNVKDPSWEDRDRFILSKGQGGVGLYPILADVGFFPKEDLDNFCGEGSKLGVHSENHATGIECLTGSLGHGISIATGMALSAKLNKQDHMVYCMVGDAELYEGSNWEGMMFGPHYHLDNLVVIVDWNKLGTLGYTCNKVGKRDGPDQIDLGDKFESFGWEVLTCDGHNFEEISTAFNWAKTAYPDLPKVIIADTTKGQGSSAMENKVGWHYQVPKGQELEKTNKELNNG